MTKIPTYGDKAVAIHKKLLTDRDGRTLLRPERLLEVTRDEAALLLSARAGWTISPDYLRQLLKSGRLKYCRQIGNTYTYLVSELLKVQFTSTHKQQQEEETYRDESTEPFSFYVDTIEDESVIPVIEEVGGTVQYNNEIQRIDGHVGRYQVTLPGGCVYAGLTHGIDNPQIITLPGGRRLTLRPRGAYEMVIHFQSGDSSDPSRWNGAQRLPDEDEE